jgi:hypothetical protein
MYAYQKNPGLKPAEAAANYAETMRLDLNAARAAMSSTSTISAAHSATSIRN